MRVPIKRDLRYLEAAGTGGWLPLPRLGTSKPSESLKSNMYNSQSFGWVLDVASRGQAGVVRSGARQALPGPATGRNRWDWRLDRGTLSPSPRPHQGAGVSPNFSPLFLGGV